MDIEYRRTRQQYDTEDLALLFVENELGRFDWRNNWTKAKESGLLPQKIRQWLDDLRIEHDPADIIRCIDTLAQERNGRWL